MIMIAIEPVLFCVGVNLIAQPRFARVGRVTRVITDEIAATARPWEHWTADMFTFCSSSPTASSQSQWGRHGQNPFQLFAMTTARSVAIYCSP